MSHWRELFPAADWKQEMMKLLKHVDSTTTIFRGLSLESSIWFLDKLKCEQTREVKKVSIQWIRLLLRLKQQGDITFSFRIKLYCQTGTDSIYSSSVQAEKSRGCESLQHYRKCRAGELMSTSAMWIQTSLYNHNILSNITRGNSTVSQFSHLNPPAATVYVKQSNVYGSMIIIILQLLFIWVLNFILCSHCLGAD